MSKAKQEYILPLAAAAPDHGGLGRLRASALSATLALLALVLLAPHARLLLAPTSALSHAPAALEPFYHSVRTHSDLCVGGVSHSGYIGIAGDREDALKRAFFWLFEAQRDAENAPVILTIGGGPGTSGMTNPLIGQSHCKVSPNLTTYPNPDAWSEHYNLLALDHPIGVGYSYGQMVNDSRDAAYDVYDFLVKFFHLYPNLAKNQFVVASGSYGGMYVPHIATVIHEQNAALAAGHGHPGARHINLSSMLVSNPISDFLSHHRWVLQQRCYFTDIYNASTCNAAFAALPACLEAAQLAYIDSTLTRRVAARDACAAVTPDIEGRDLQNVERKCDGTVEDCYPATVYVGAFMNLASTKEALGVPQHLNWAFVRMAVWEEFFAMADRTQPAYLLYEPLLEAGYRLLHYVGKLDANCGWPGVLSTLRLLPSSYQSAFNDAPDLTWPGHAATVRAVARASDEHGAKGAGAFAFVLMDHAGHFVTHDQPTLVKEIVRRWIANVGWNETLNE
ncbi:carboxypeptidase [Phanerochaete sordida]|uniref:carboxypeptidase C n=1 Tax=Phanerochaete sordida TaxID=48140 RepID=A0A9P3GG41_9APHY|nr:carboxypeptidase [Phanerochaete sordida]